jgi:hypothetical protein
VRGSDAPVHKVTRFKGTGPRTADETLAVEGESWRYVDTTTPMNLQEPAEHATSGAVLAKSNVEGWRSRDIRVVMYALGAVSVLLLTLLFYTFFLKPHAEQATVVGFDWWQNVEVQEYSVVHEDRWGSPPSDAYNIQSSYMDTGRDEKIHDGWRTESYTDTCYRSESYTDTCYRQVYDSRTCTETQSNGDGSFDTYTYECGSSSSEPYSCTAYRDVPYSCQKTRQVEEYHYEDVYDYFFVYDINRWVAISNYPTRGTDQNPRFAEVTLADRYTGFGEPQVGQKKYVEQYGTYSVTFLADDSDIGNSGYFEKEYSLLEWESFVFGEKYDIQVNFFDEILSYPTP